MIVCFGGTIHTQATEKIEVYSMSQLKWTLSGYWGAPDHPNVGIYKLPFDSLETNVPGSVQNTLLKNGMIKEWNYGLNSLDCEWIENRQWVYKTTIPNEWLPDDATVRIIFKGLDDNGKIFINRQLIGTFDNAFISYTFEINPYLKKDTNELMIVFEQPPVRFMGAVTETSGINDFKPRFYYGWDWMPRIVQIGIWDDVLIETIPKKTFSEIESLKVFPSAHKEKNDGTLYLKATYKNRFFSHYYVKIQLSDPKGKILVDAKYPSVELKRGLNFEHLKIERWFPNGFGAQPLYRLRCSMLDQNDVEVQTVEKMIGFRHQEWLPCNNAPADADPWICSINGTPVFMQGVNWTPIRPNFADLQKEDYEKLLLTYKRLGLNTIRIWGGGFPEKDWLYELCDQYGIMIWQDFPLSSSGLDNYPPTDPGVIQVMAQITRSYVQNRHSHVSLILWCGGNELYEFGNTAPVTDTHPMIKCLQEIVGSEDSGRRFVPGSPSGPNIWGDWENFGKGINWETHGPWFLPSGSNGCGMQVARDYWKKNDALFNSEVGVGGASPVTILRKYAGDYDPFPANGDNPLWRQFNWWIDWNDYLFAHNNTAPKDLETYVEWSQQKQAEALSIALESCKDRFPACGGFLIWMGHDSYPTTANTSIIDFHGDPKPAAMAVSKIWLKKQTNN